MNTATSPLNRLAIACLAALSTAVISTGALADTVSTSDGVKQVRVQFEDLNLSSPEGNVALYHRIRNAAQQVCPSIYVRDLAQHSAAQKCQADAIEQAVRSINSPQLAMLWMNHSPHG